MRQRGWIVCVVLIVVSVAAGIGVGYLLWRPTPAITLAVETKLEVPKPSLSLDSHKTLKLKHESAIEIWEGHAYGLKEAKLRLWYLRDGDDVPVQEADLSWDEWPKEQATSKWRIYLVHERDSEPAAGGKRVFLFSVPSAGVQFDTAPIDKTSSEESGPREVGRKFVTVFEDHALPKYIQPSEPRLVYTKYYFPKAGQRYSFDPSETINSLKKKAVDGCVIVALTVEWK